MASFSSEVFWEEAGSGFFWIRKQTAYAKAVRCRMQTQQKMPTTTMVGGSHAVVSMAGPTEGWVAFPGWGRLPQILSEISIWFHVSFWLVELEKLSGWVVKTFQD